MTRPAQRSMRALPQLERRRDALEKCVFCPKLCRSACPVSNADARETTTPWGKMSLAWMAAHGDIPVDRSHAAPAWACSGCFACREACDHRNVVADVLLEARDALARSGHAPEGAKRVIAQFARHDARTNAAARALGHHSSVGREAKDALLVGCGYLRGAPREARDAVEAASAILGRPVAVVESCCGLPLRLAGDAARFAQQARGVAQALSKHDRVVVVDAGCALALKQRYPDVGVHLGLHVETLVEVAARNLPGLARVPFPEDAIVRWHDPCQLGRGLGIYEAPRNILTRALGRAPEELEDRREQALCSGAGGLLPSTLPSVASAISEARWSAHRRAGGGRVVTGCASSLAVLRRRAAGSGIIVDDLVTWIARAARAGNATSQP
jgi:dimethylglycine catabolism B